jgi:hypothetical protein
MPFDYLKPNIPADVTARGPAAHKAMREVEVRDRARLFKRLGYDQEYAVARCLAKLAAGYEIGGVSPLDEVDVRRLVSEGWR